MNKIVLHLGSNLGDRKYNLSRALDELSKLLKDVSASSIYETAAWGNENQSAFLNQALVGYTNEPLLRIWPKLYAIESLFSIKDDIDWGPREMDIDLLYYEQKIHWSNNLEIPHPRLHLRKFVLIPLVDILPEDIHPVYKETNRALLMTCQDPLAVRKYEEI